MANIKSESAVALEAKLYSNGDSGKPQLSAIRFGLDNQGRIPLDGENLPVQISEFIPHVEVFDGEVKWKAWILAFEPENHQVRGFKVRLFLRDGETFETPSEDLLKFVDRFSQFASEAYEVTDFSLADLIGSSLSVIHSRKRDTDRYSTIQIVQIQDIPALSKQPLEADEASVTIEQRLLESQRQLENVDTTDLFDEED
jgi:hypothetical protein